MASDCRVQTLVLFLSGWVTSGMFGNLSRPHPLLHKMGGGSHCTPHREGVSGKWLAPRKELRSSPACLLGGCSLFLFVVTTPECIKAGALFAFSPATL